MNQLRDSSVLMKFEDGGRICRENDNRFHDDRAHYAVYGKDYIFEFRLDLDTHERPSQLIKVFRSDRLTEKSGRTLGPVDRVRKKEDCTRKLRAFVQDTGLIKYLRYVPFPSYHGAPRLQIPTFDLEIPLGIRDSTALSSDNVSELFDTDLWEIDPDQDGVFFFPKKHAPLRELWSTKFGSPELGARCLKLHYSQKAGYDWRTESVRHLTETGIASLAHAASARESIVSFIGNGIGRLPPEEESWWWQVNSDPGELVGIEEGQMELYELLDEICPMLWPESRWQAWALEVALPEWIVP